MMAWRVFREGAGSGAVAALRHRRGRWPVLLLLASTPPVAATDALIWSDEFDGARLDTSVWERQVGDGSAYDLPAGWGNQELQLYDGSDRSSFVAEGHLHIVARRGDEGTFTSARLRTRHRRDVLYGRIEARIKVPAAQGMWPAFWMMPTDSRYGTWAACGEIDIMETTNLADKVYGTLHFGGQWPENTSAGGHRSFEDGQLWKAFHVYGVEWTPDEISWFVDGEKYHSVRSDAWYSKGAPDNPRAPFDQPFHLLLNLAVGGRWPGAPDEETAFPQTMLVDWVRIWEIDLDPEPTPPSAGEPAGAAP